jgi:DNA-binding GntR family transcriptional regulator
MDSREALKRESADALYEQLADVIRQRIADGTYSGRVPSIIDLRAEFGVARGTAHQALTTVAEWGLVKLTPGRGYYTTPGARERAAQVPAELAS